MEVGGIPTGAPIAAGPRTRGLAPPAAWGGPGRALRPRSTLMALPHDSTVPGPRHILGPEARGQGG